MQVANYYVQIIASWALVQGSACKLARNLLHVAYLSLPVPTFCPYLFGGRATFFPYTSYIYISVPTCPYLNREIYVHILIRAILVIIGKRWVKVGTGRDRICKSLFLKAKGWPYLVRDTQPRQLNAKGGAM